MLSSTSLLRWLQRKRYQYEVTFSLYMLTPTEKFIFNSFIFLFLSMIVIAASLYLPQWITNMLSRAWFYYTGHDTDRVRDILSGGGGVTLTTTIVKRQPAAGWGGSHGGL